MDFRFTAQEETFRATLRAFLDQELGEGWSGHSGDTLFAFEDEWLEAVAFTRRLARHGWVAPHWPVEYGGAGLTVMEQLIFNEEMALRNAPVVNGPGIGMVGPTLILHGSEEQKRRFLPRITAVDEIWCQGYSEPGAGSDLASLQTHAVRDGDDYVVNGQKIWTTNAHHADWMVLLVRTDPDAPKHRGISMLLVDMRTPGITVHPLPNMAGLHTFNQVFLDNVRVPRTHLVGEENHGWYVGVTLLDFERSNIGANARLRREFGRLLAALRDSPYQNMRTSLRAQLADLAIAIEAGRTIAYRVAFLQSQGKIPNYEASMSKLFHSELAQRLANVCVQAFGLAGQVLPETTWHAPAGGRFCLEYMESVPATIAAGTSEVQRNVIATRGLGLPRA
jgi:alkylation response protein AidB-like acyl-CoA dehydrogenase